MSPRICLLSTILSENSLRMSFKGRVRNLEQILIIYHMITTATPDDCSNEAEELDQHKRGDSGRSKRMFSACFPRSSELKTYHKGVRMELGCRRKFFLSPKGVSLRHLNLVPHTGPGL